ncbi:MAG: Crp/Fnr family transcriptional regulator [Alcaligenaceae bacterium]|nr:Crp/Fnr family transcriptional regulator [Alcaligenaceae bacterium]
MSHSIPRSLVKDLDLFRAVPEQDLDAVLAIARPMRLVAGDPVFQQGQSAEQFFILLHGHLKVVQTTAEGEQVMVRYVIPGEVFGIAKAMRRPTYPASCMAVEESIVLAWPSSEWDHFMTGNLQFAANALQAVGQRLQDAQTRIKELSTEEVEQRVARCILRLVDSSGEKTEDGIAINFPITRQEIAEMTGTTLHTVSRLLSAWKERGMVNTGRKLVIVRKMDDLIRLAEGNLSDSANKPAARKNPV